MNADKVIQELKQRYPGKTIICHPPSDPSEILCEIESSGDHPEYSVAISVIDTSAVHVQHVTTEEYEVIKGFLTLYKNGQSYELKPGDRKTISSHKTHYAVGNETWIKATSHPGWTSEDHQLVNGKN